MLEFLKKLLVNLTTNTNINFFAGRTTRMAPLNALPLNDLRVVTRNYGVEFELHEIFSVKVENGNNAYNSISAHFNLTNVFKKYIYFKQKKQLAVIKVQKEAALAELNSAKAASQDFQTSFNTNFAHAIELQRFTIMTLCAFFLLIGFIYKDKKISGYYCNIQIPAGNPRITNFEFFKEFLYPTNFLDTTNFCENLAKKSCLGLEPSEIFHNFVKVQTFCFQIISHLGQIGFRLLFVSPLVGLMNQAVFVSYFQLKTKNSFFLLITGFASYLITYSMIDTIIKTTYFCFQNIFGVGALVVRSIAIDGELTKLKNSEKEKSEKY